MKKIGQNSYKKKKLKTKLIYKSKIKSSKNS